MLKSLYTVLFSMILYLPVCSQSVGQLISYADKKFEEGMYQLAAREYQRALFFGEKENVGLLSLKTGDCYFESGEYASALRYFEFASNIILDDSLKYEAILRKASCQLLLRDYQQAVFLLLSNQSFIHTEQGKKRDLILGIAYFALMEDQKSELRFISIIDSTSQEKKIRLIELFDSNKLKWPNPKLAYWLSVFIPGTGQFYAGDIKNGMNSLLLNGSLIYLSFWMAGKYSVWDSLFTIFPWWPRDYSGGYKSAKEIANQKRLKNRAEVYNLIYKELESEFSNSANILNKKG